MPSTNRGIDLKALRKQARRTQAEMAALCHVSTRTWMRWEKDPGKMPRDAYESALDLLERSVQIRKEITMARDYENGTAVFDPDDGGDPAEDFRPSRPVSIKQWVAWEDKGIEPYEGFAEEIDKWEGRQETELRKFEEDNGIPAPLSDTVHPDPEFDPETGDPIHYGNEPEIAIDRKTGKATLSVETDEQPAE